MTIRRHAAESRGIRIGNAQRQCCGDRCIDGVSAFLEDSDRGACGLC